MAITPGTYLRLRREAAGLSIEDVAGVIATVPHMDALGRAGWLRLVEADETPIGADVIDTLRNVFRFDQVVLMDLDDIARGATVVPAPRLCRLCACSENDACIDPVTHIGCAWVAAELCSACALPPAAPAAAATATGLAA